MTAVRITDQIERSQPARVRVNGGDIIAFEGENLAAALLAAGISHLRESPRDGAPRGAFCFMGVCQECVVQVNGDLRQACLTSVAEDMIIELRGPI